MPKEKDKTQQYGPSAKKEPRLEYEYPDKDEPLRDVFDNVHQTAESYLRYHEGNYEFANNRHRAPEQGNPDNFPDVTSRLKMNKKARDMVYNNQDPIYDKMGEIEMELQGMGLLAQSEELDKNNIKRIEKTIPSNSKLDIEEMKKSVNQDENLSVISKSMLKNMKGGRASSTFKAALKSSTDTENDVEMSDAQETSHTDRVSRKRSFYSTNGPGYQGYER